MLNGLYSAAAGMIAQQTRIDALSNDIANVNTTGYKQVRIGFRDLVYNIEAGMRIGAGSAVVDAGRVVQPGRPSADRRSALRRDRRPRLLPGDAAATAASRSPAPATSTPTPTASS